MVLDVVSQQVHYATDVPYKPSYERYVVINAKFFLAQISVQNTHWHIEAACLSDLRGLAYLKAVAGAVPFGKLHFQTS